MNENITFDEIYRHGLAQRSGGREIDSLDGAYLREKIETSAIELLQVNGLIPVLLCELGLYDLCRTLQISNKGKKRNGPC